MLALVHRGADARSSLLGTTEVWFRSNGPDHINRCCPLPRAVVPRAAYHCWVLYYRVPNNGFFKKTVVTNRSKGTCAARAKIFVVDFQPYFQQNPYAPD